MRSKHKIFRGLMALAMVAGAAAAVVPISPALALTMGAVTVTPNTPGVAAQYSITWSPVAGTPAAGEPADLVANVDQITLAFSSGPTLPATIDKSRVSISSLDVGTAPTSPSIDPVVDVTARTITVTVPDMDPGAGTLGLQGNGPHTITFSPLAGIVNANAAHPTNTGTTTANVRVSTTKEAAATTGGTYSIRRIVTLSSGAGARGGNVTITGKGFATGTVTIWNDNSVAAPAALGDGILQAAEQTLGTATVGSDNTFTFVYTVDSRMSAGANRINAKDSAGVTLGRDAAGIALAAPVNAPPGLILLGTIIPSPTSGLPGTQITLNLSDFAPGGSLFAASGATVLEAVAGQAAAQLGIADTTLTVTDPSVISVGQTLLIGAEQMGVTAKGNVATGATVTEGAGGLTAADVTLTVSAGGGASFAVGQTIIVDAEQMTVTAIAVDDLTVTRGANGTTAAVHATGAAISWVNALTVTRGANATTPAVQASGTAVNIIGRINIGGIPLVGCTPTAIGATVGATTSVTCTLPTVGLQAGTQQIVVNVVGTAVSRSANFTVQGSPMTASPTTVVPGQTVTVSGSGFTPSSTPGGPGPGGVHRILAASITLGGVAIAGAPQVDLDSGGAWVTQLTLPTAGAILTPGSYDIAATDTGGRSGTVAITVPARNMTVTPASSQRGTTVTAAMTGFPGSASVTISYAGTPVATVITDATGAAGASFTVPTTAGIPSSNSVTAVSSVGGGAATASATHTVPSPSITVSPTSSFPGGTITVTGTNFPAFSALTNITIGGISAIPSPAPATDGFGNLTANVLVPQVATGAQAVLVTVGGSTANAAVTIAAAPPSAPPKPEVALAALIASNRLEIASSFNYTTGKYEAFVPGLAGNPLQAISPNSVLFLTLTQDATVVVSGIAFNVKAGVGTPIPVGAVVTVTVQ